MRDTTKVTMEHRTEPDTGVDIDPIAGVSLELYARIVRSIAMMNHDVSMLGPMAALHGVDAAAWSQARSGWNRRIAGDEAITVLFREMYQAS